MGPFLVLAFLVLAGVAPAHGTITMTHIRGTPVQKVLQMLTDMVAKGNAEKGDEAKVFEDYEHWVHGQKRDTDYSIKQSKEQIEKLVAEIDKAESDIKVLSADIDELDGEIGAWEADQKAATQLREAQNAEYNKVEADYSESLDALDRAMAVLSAGTGDVPQAAELLQNVPMLTGVLSLLQQADSGAPAVNAYESQSGGIIEMLEKFKKKFKKELEDVTKAEMNSAHAFQMEMLHLGDNIESAKSNRNEKAELRAELSQQSAEAQAALIDEKTSLDEDEKYLADVKATFMQKQAAFEENQKTRSEEITALEKAIEIISGGSVSGAAEKHLPGLVQQSQAVSLLQLGTASQRASVKQRVAEFLEHRATSLSSKVLSLLAVQIAASPFAKVIQMVKDLIERLEEEAQAEAGHKAFCDEELHNNKVQRDTKSSEVAVLKATIEKVDSEIKNLAKHIATLAKEQQELSTAMQEATKNRQVEKDENTQTIKDAKEALTALDAALAVLKEFYSKQGGFLQVKQVPEMASYGGQQGSTGGVMGMIEVIQSDFARLKTETESAEDQGAKEYDEFMKVSKADRESKHKEEFDKTMLNDKKEFDKHMAEKDMAAAQEELDFALDYYDKLKPQCIEVKVSYEERVKRRQEEIDALGEAYKILSGEGAAAL